MESGWGADGERLKTGLERGVIPWFNRAVLELAGFALEGGRALH